MRTLHRVITLFIVLFTLYLGATGTLIQLIDLRTLFTHAPADDPNMMAIREGLDGPGDFQAITNADYTAPALPGEFNAVAALPVLLGAARAALGAAPLDFLEWRVADSRVVGQVRTGKRLLRFDAASGAALPELQAVPGAGGTFGASDRNTFKGLHRMTSFGDRSLWINVFVSVGLGVLIVTGLMMYFRLLAARGRQHRGGLFWVAGGWWRSLHRWIALTAALFVAVVALSGFWLAFESLGRAINADRERAARVAGAPRPAPAVSSLQDGDLPAMLQTTLAAYQRMAPDGGVRGLRLRVYGGMPQGVVISGETEARQIVFNALNGRRASETEPGYPPSLFPFGWQAHQVAKQIHRGDIIGLPGRWMDLFAGLSILFLSVSGAVMYLDMWKRRRSTGRRGLFWR